MLILNYQRMSTEDGPGLRTTLFVKGSPLRCRWCHNPESISKKRENEWIATRCIGCGSCIKSCKNEAVFSTADGITFDRGKCVVCGACVNECPTGAIETKGEEKTVDEIFSELIKDRAYFGIDGGVTLSGGEIMSQADEAQLLLKKLKEAGINTAVDTSGLCKKEDFEKVLPYVDVFLYDIKIFDGEKHKEFTGADNSVILSNFNYLSDAVKNTGAKIWIRTPIIPGATDDDDNIRSIARFIKGRFDRWEMCAFNNLCRDKYERLYQDWFYKKTKLMTKKRMDELLNIALCEGLVNVFVTGATQLEREE